MATITTEREWDNLYEGRVLMHIPYGGTKIYVFHDSPDPMERAGRPTLEQAMWAAIKDGKAENGPRLVFKRTMRLIPKDQEHLYRNNPDYVILPPPDGVRIKDRKITETWGEIVVFVDGKAVALFPHSTDPKEWDGRITSKREAIKRAKVRARHERDRPRDLNTLPIPNLSQKEQDHRRIKRELDDLIVRTSGKSICGPDDA